MIWPFDVHINNRYILVDCWKIQKCLKLQLYFLNFISLIGRWRHDHLAVCIYNEWIYPWSNQVWLILLTNNRRLPTIKMGLYYNNCNYLPQICTRFAEWHLLGNGWSLFQKFTLQSVNPGSKSVSFVPTSSSQKKQAKPTQDLVLWNFEVTFLAYWPLCDYLHPIGYPCQSLISPIYLMHLTWFSSCRFVSDCLAQHDDFLNLHFHTSAV